MIPGQLINDSAVVLGAYENGSEEWHAARATGLGGSEISALVGLNPWESWFSTYYRKRDKLRPVEASNPMKWGTLFEPVIYEEFRRNHLAPGLTMTTGHTFHHKDRRWQIANPDGLIWDKTGKLIKILEIKLAGNDEKWGPDGTDQIPIYYRCQLAWYCDVMGVNQAILRAVISSYDERTYYVTITDEDRQFLREHGWQFIQDLEAGNEPNLDGHMATYRAIKEMHPLIDGSVVQLPTALADRFWAKKDAMDAATEGFNEVRNEVAMKMGMARMAMCGDEKIAYRIRPRKEGDDPYVKAATRPPKTDIIAAAA
ncbi:hypothetical protein GS982_01790 [Rhodococcus hoagii]|uniref:YqaJ viral recombinase domain-containing protein n=1 Tax=Rhodococcus hoagii TaxID=43767 RepID=A0A9Q4ZIU3_RHOHA|nr:hypothetical protein [Prescottella equi]NKT77332.1 hypothetical protein [Prescottella equi]NKZ81117.1 hypothetical protein [Prescottella equi]